MRVSKERAAENRARILTAAARLFRERGLSGVGVDALGEAAGMTHGSLYSQFGSKERLAAEALTEALARSAGKAVLKDAAPGEGALRGFVARYLSVRHRDEPGQGCALAALGCEIPRQPSAVRRAFTEGLLATVGRIARLLPQRRRQPREDDALAVMAALVGALVLARAVDDPALSERILAAARDRLTEDMPGRPDPNAPVQHEAAEHRKELVAMDGTRNASVAVVGAGDFIGAAIARRFAAGGYTVSAGRRNGEKLAPLVAEIEAAGGRCAAARLDARKEEAVAAFLAEADARRAARGLRLQRRRQRQLPDPRHHRARVPQGLGDGVLRAASSPGARRRA